MLKNNRHDGKRNAIPALLGKSRVVVIIVVLVVIII